MTNKERVKLWYAGDDEALTRPSLILPDHIKPVRKPPTSWYQRTVGLYRQRVTFGTQEGKATPTPKF